MRKSDAENTIVAAYQAAGYTVESVKLHRQGGVACVDAVLVKDASRYSGSAEALTWHRLAHHVQGVYLRQWHTEHVDA